MNTGVSPTVLIVVAIVAALGVVLGALVTGWVNLRVERVKAHREREAWLREKRLQACIDLLSGLNTLWWLAHDMSRDVRAGSEFKELEPEVLRSADALLLLSPETGEVFSNSWNELIDAFKIVDRPGKLDEKTRAGVLRDATRAVQKVRSACVDVMQKESA